MNSKIYWISYNIDIVLMVLGVAIILSAIPIGDYFVKINSSIDLTGVFVFIIGVSILATGIASSILIRLYFKKR